MQKVTIRRLEKATAVLLTLCTTLKRKKQHFLTLIAFLSKERRKKT
jgi:hypothetical protein